MANAIAEKVLCLPIYPALTDAQIDEIARSCAQRCHDIGGPPARTDAQRRRQLRGRAESTGSGSHTGTGLEPPAIETNASSASRPPPGTNRDQVASDGRRRGSGPEHHQEPPGLGLLSRRCGRGVVGSGALRPTSLHSPVCRGPAYVGRLLEIARNEGCALLFPGLDAELPVLAHASEAFRRQASRFWSARPK